MKLREGMAIDKEELTWADSIRKDTDMGSVQQLAFFPKKGSLQTGRYTAFVTAPFFLWLPGEMRTSLTTVCRSPLLPRPSGWRRLVPSR